MGCRPDFLARHSHAEKHDLGSEGGDVAQHGGRPRRARRHVEEAAAAAQPQAWNAGAQAFESGPQHGHFTADVIDREIIVAAEGEKIGQFLGQREAHVGADIAPQQPAPEHDGKAVGVNDARVIEELAERLVAAKQECSVQVHVADGEALALRHRAKNFLLESVIGD